MTFAGGAADHERAHEEETREDLSHSAGHALEELSRAAEQVLVENEEGLNRLRSSLRVFENEVAVLEPLNDRIFDDAIIPIILAMIGKARSPGGALLDLRTGGDVDGAVRGGKLHGLDSMPWPSVDEIALARLAGNSAGRGGT